MFGSQLWQPLLDKRRDTLAGIGQIETTQIGFRIGAVCDFRQLPLVQMDQAFGLPEGLGGKQKQALRELLRGFHEHRAGHEFVDQSPLQRPRGSDGLARKTQIERARFADEGG